MKTRKLAIALSSLTMLLLSLFIFNNPSGQIMLPSQQIINPFLLKEEKPSPQSLLQIYNTIFSFVKMEKYNDALNKLSELNLVYFPPGIRDTVTSFNNLLNSTITHLKDIKDYISRANSTLKLGNLTLAKELLLGANNSLIEVNNILNQLSLIVNDVSSSINFPIDRMNEYLMIIKDKINTYSSFIEQLYSKINLVKQLIIPTIRIKSSLLSAFVGEEIEILGYIEGNGTPISNALISIFINNINYTTIKSNEYGNFSLKYKIPYIYNNTLKIFASYQPKGEEIDKYSPSISNILILNILFYTPELIVNYPQIVYPTKIYYISGRVSLNGNNLNNIEVQIKFYNLTYTNKTIGGYFSFQLEIPKDIQEGNYTLSIFTLPNGTIGPSSEKFIINVLRIEPQLDLSYSNFIITGSSIVIEGIIKSNNTPLAGAKISVLNSLLPNYAISDEKGRFKLIIYTNVFSLSGNYKVQLKIEPNVGYSKDKIITITIYTINPFLIAIVFFFSSISFYLLYSTYRKRPEVIKEKIEKEEKTIVHVERVVEKIYSGILKIYYNTVSFIEKITGIKLLPHHTIREYAKLIENKIKYFPGFWKISILTERYLYREENIDKNTLEIAENEQKKLMEENG